MTRTATGALIGYARTSTVEQDAGLEAQMRDLEALGCGKVFHEKVSSVDAARPELKRALDYLREGDTFVVTRPDRLARSTLDLLNIVDDLTKRGVAVRILSMDLDTGNATGRLILTILAGIGEFERSLMLERQRAGIAKAKAEGKYKGRAPTARAKAADVKALKADGVGVAEIVRRTGVSRASVYRILEDAA
jgi:DNA invertase Pin-like site-specific DNA recombinase